MPTIAPASAVTSIATGSAPQNGMPSLVDEHRGRVGADRGQRDMADRDLAGEAFDDVEAGRQDDVDRHHVDDVLRVGVAQQQRQRQQYQRRRSATARSDARASSQLAGRCRGRRRGLGVALVRSCLRVACIVAACRRLAVRSDTGPRRATVAERPAGRTPGASSGATSATSDQSPKSGSNDTRARIAVSKSLPPLVYSTRMPARLPSRHCGVGSAQKLIGPDAEPLEVLDVRQRIADRLAIVLQASHRSAPSLAFFSASLTICAVS